MPTVASFLIWRGLPNREGFHRRFLRFSAARVRYPCDSWILALGAAAINQFDRFLELQGCKRHRTPG